MAEQLLVLDICFLHFDNLGRAGSVGRRNESALDRIAEGVLRRVRFDRRDPVWKYLGAIEQDQGAVLQLTPEGIELFDAAVADRAGIEYGCVVSGVPKPSERFRVKELANPDCTLHCVRCSGCCTH